MSKFQIPESFLEKLNEFSSGGYLLFCFDEDGDPDFHIAVDSEKDFHALINHARAAVDALDISIMSKYEEKIKNFIETDIENEEEDEE